MKSKKRQQTTKRSTIKQQIAPANDKKKNQKRQQKVSVNDKPKHLQTMKRNSK